MTNEAVSLLSAEIAFRSLSDRTRLRILNLLRQRELRVFDLVAILNVPQPKTSRHLAYLRKAGLVVTRRDGQWVHYQLASFADSFHRQIAQCLESLQPLIPEFKLDSEKLQSTSGPAQAE